MATPRIPERIVVIQTAFLGDIVLATSFLGNLRSLAPGADIRLLTTPVGAKVLNPNPFGVQLIPYDKRGRDRGPGGFLRIARELRAFAPELAFCLHRSFRSALLSKVSGAEIFGFLDGAGSLLFDHRVNRNLPGAVFEAEKNHTLLTAWAGAAAQGLPLFPVLQTTKEDEAEAERLLAGLSRFVAFAPSSVWATKRWPPERFAVVAKALQEKHGLSAVVVGGNEPADREAASAMAAAIGGEARLLDLAGKTPLGVLKAVLARATLLVANDTAPLHVAIAMGVPVLGVFGPTTRSLGFFPLAPAGRSAIAEHPDMPCRPCGLHGHQVCPRQHFRCMLELEPAAVLKEAEALLCR